jgi:hypothetical protein
MRKKKWPCINIEINQIKTKMNSVKVVLLSSGHEYG